MPTHHAMKVVHTGHAPILPGHPDYGKFYYHPGRWALNLAIAQKQFTDLDVEFVTQVPGASGNFHTVVDGVPVHYLAAPDRFRATTFFVFDIRRISKFIRGLGPDVVHAHGTEESYALAAQACGCPSVITAQGCFFIINREMPPGPLSRARLVQFTEWLAFRRAGHVIAKSKYVHDELKRAFPHLVLHEIPNTIDPRLLDIPADRPRRAGHMAFVGTVVERKGVHLVADALEILNAESGKLNLGNLKPTSRGAMIEERGFSTLDSRLSPLPTLHIFGNREDPSHYEQTMLARLRRTLGDRLILHGSVPSLQVVEELATIELLLAPSIEEMFGNQVIEALMAGTWPIVSSGTAMEQTCQRVEAGLVVQNGDAKDLSQKIQESFQKLNRWDRENTRQQLEEWIGPLPVAKQHQNLYENLPLGTAQH